LRKRIELAVMAIKAVRQSLGTEFHGLEELQASRFRNRKINFKVKLPIHTGSFDIVYDDISESQEDGKRESAGDGADRPAAGVETGVDKEEEGVRRFLMSADISLTRYSRRSTCKMRYRPRPLPSLRGPRQLAPMRLPPLCLPR
jgi:hypothetical protein